jgi:hypothetical protein
MAMSDKFSMEQSLSVIISWNILIYINK